MSALFPFCLAIVARMPFFRGKNALQFLAAVLVIVAMWVMVVALAPDVEPGDVSTSAMILGAAILCYLEVWALLSRGYTIRLLLTLHDARKPLSAAELAAGYRAGNGLDWIMTHRTGGLIAAGLVHRNGEDIALTPGLGVSVAALYRASVALLGLRRAG